jgi:hypothetical protein
MVLLAFSLQDQVEKYGAYVGIAAFFGLAVLSLLYFAQARELKRLREWAGRAPERAQELEERVMAQAQATAAPAAPRRPSGVPLPQRPAPPRKLSELPAPETTAQATELAEPVEVEPATNGNVPAIALAAGAANGAAADREAPGDAAPPAVNGVGPARDGQQTEDGAPVAPDAAADEGEAEPASPNGVAAGAEAEPAAAAPAEPAADPPAGAAPAEPAADPPADAAAAPADGAPAEPAAPADAEADPDRAADGGLTLPPVGAIAASATTQPQGSPIPRKTPAQRPPTPAPAAAAPLRAGQTSATPRRPPPRRPAAAATTGRQGRSAGTYALLIGLAVLILGGGAFFVSQLGGDDEPTQPNQAAAPAAETPAATGTSGGTDQGVPAAQTTVTVLNGTTTPGLAKKLADSLKQAGYPEPGSETNTRDQTLQQSTVYYGDGYRAQARRVAQRLGIANVAAVDAETRAVAPDADVVVLAGADAAS